MSEADPLTAAILGRAIKGMAGAQFTYAPLKETDPKRIPLTHFDSVYFDRFHEGNFTRVMVVVKIKKEIDAECPRYVICRKVFEKGQNFEMFIKGFEFAFCILCDSTATLPIEE